MGLKIKPACFNWLILKQGCSKSSLSQLNPKNPDDLSFHSFIQLKMGKISKLLNCQMVTPLSA